MSDGLRGGRRSSGLRAPRGLEVTSVVWSCEDCLVLSVPLRTPRWPPLLTPAERAVATRLLEGASNAEIARERGTSERTVVNQVAKIFRKAGVTSRVELAAHVFRR
jgi:DNA-binding NarL/FixJ family response regulator